LIQPAEPHRVSVAGGERVWEHFGAHAVDAANVVAVGDGGVAPLGVAVPKANTKANFEKPGNIISGSRVLCEVH
jgi:hypothetical protein